jgi:hypothetical protein
MYVHEVPAQDGVPVDVSHATPHAPQLVVVVTDVSQPFVLGGAVSQSWKPVAQLEYAHVVPLQVGPTLCAVSHTLLHPPQLVVLPRFVSQPFVSGAVVVQSAKPGAHPVYSQEVPLHVAPTLWVVSHALPQAAQLDVVSSAVEHPAVLGGAGLQSA